jgi:hypothetical protein
MKKLSLLFIIIFCVVAYAGESKENVPINDSVDPVVHEILKCESEFIHEKNWGDCDGSGIKNEKHCQAFGWAQFHKNTFLWMKELAGMPELKWKSKKDQLWLLKWALRNNLGRHWTCYKTIGA